MPYYLPGQPFIHETNTNNIEGNYTYIDSNLTNNQPDALVFVTERWNPHTRNYNDVSLGVWYHKGKWSIYNQRREDGTLPPMKAGTLFNVFVQYTTSTAKKEADKTPIAISSPTRVQLSRSFMILSYSALALVIAWLTVGFGIYLLQNASIQHWQSMFLMRNNPVISLSLLALTIVLLLMFVERQWGKLFQWFSQLDPLKQPMKMTLLLSITFLVMLFMLSFVFPSMTGYTFKSDWSLLVSATIPLFALVAFIVINRYQSLKFEGGSIKFEFSGVMMTSELDSTQTIMLDIPLEETSIDAWLRKIKTKAMPTEARILLIQFDTQTPLEYIALQKYVHEMASMAPITYIVFLSSSNLYMGFVTVERFQALAGVNIQHITESNVQAQLSLNRQFIDESKAKGAFSDAYSLLVQNNLLGIPVVDEGKHFLGILEREKIEQAVIIQFLEKNAKQTKEVSKDK